MTNITLILKHKFVIIMKYTQIIRPAPTFKLSNQLLVSVTQKIIAQSDLNLLFTKYYKERLKFRLKNSEKNIINHILTDYLLTKLTKSTKSQRRTNYFPIIKLSHKKFFLPISLPLPISLSLSLSSIVNFSIPLVFSHNLFYLDLDLEHKVSPHLAIITSLFVDKMVLFLKQREKKKVTLIESVSLKDSLKDLVSVSILIYSQAVISYPGSFRAPYFE